MKVIDFCKKGNVVRFYLGRDDLEDYGGDDWDDSPYDCNAGTVYDEYVGGYMDIAFPFDYSVLEPCDGAHNCGYAKDDMVDGIVPCILVVPPEVLEDAPWHGYDFNYWVGGKDVARVYFGETQDAVKAKFHEMMIGSGCEITETQVKQV